MENHQLSRITEKLNLVYDEEKNDLDESLLQMQIRSIDKEKW